MLNTTLRIPDDLGAFLQEAARDRSLSVNAFLTLLLEEKREEERRRRLARDWAEYAKDPQAQEVEYAWPAQADLVAEPPSPYGGKPAPRRRK